MLAADVGIMLATGIVLADRLSWPWLALVDSTLLTLANWTILWSGSRAGTQQTQAEIERLARFPGENPNPILRVQRDNVLEYANKSSQVLLEAWQIGLRQKVPPEIATEVQDAFDSGTVGETEVQYADTVYHLTFAPVPAHGYVNVYGRDVTAAKQTMHEMVEAREAALEAARAKSEFLANMSHEIRTPMNGIMGMTELVLETELTQEQRESLNIVRTSAESLLQVLNDILDFSKIEAGRLKLEKIPFCLRDTFNETLKTLALSAHRKGLELTCDIPAEIPDVVLGDPGRLRQIILNLAGNSIKFTETGEVGLTVRQEHVSADTVLLTLTVSDTGVGIPAHKRQAVFQPFAQADGSTTRQYGGTGLGLAITTQLVKMMDGRIWLESEVGEGSAFHVRFTLGLQADHELPSTLSGYHEFPEGNRILIAEHSGTSRRYLAQAVANWNLRPETTGDGDMVMELMSAASTSGQGFDLVLLDVGLPRMDGLALAREIRADAALRGTPIILLTYVGGQRDTDGYRELGISGSVIKPVSTPELLDAIRKAFVHPTGRTGAVVPAKQLVPRERSRSLRLLLAEDNPFNQVVAVRMLEKHGHEVVAVANGREALETLATSTFDLVLMDIQMPEMDGFEATAAIRSGERDSDAHIPILALTAHAMQGDRARCLATGMDGYLTKPIRQDQLQQALSELAGQGTACAVVPY